SVTPRDPYEDWSPLHTGRGASRTGREVCGCPQFCACCWCPGGTCQVKLSGCPDITAFAELALTPGRRVARRRAGADEAFTDPGLVHSEPKDSQRTFVIRQVARCRRMIAAGLQT